MRASSSPMAASEASPSVRRVRRGCGALFGGGIGANQGYERDGHERATTNGSVRVFLDECERLRCEGCANDSIAFDKGGALRSIVIDNDTGETRFFPAAIMGEANRLKGLLESRGFNVKIDTALNICVIS